MGKNNEMLARYCAAGYTGFDGKRNAAERTGGWPEYELYTGYRKMKRV